MKKLSIMVALLFFACNVYADVPEGAAFTSKPSKVNPSQESIEKGKRALNWCTNNYYRISAHIISDSLIVSAADKYFEKREGIVNEPNLMEYVPQGEEFPTIDGAGREEVLKIFEGMSFRQMTERCDSDMMAAVNKINNLTKPTNLAEEKIALIGYANIREAMTAEQEIGKKMGYQGIIYGIVDTLDDIESNKYTVDQFKPFLLKRSEYDSSWVLTNATGDIVAYEKWDGIKSRILVVVKTKGRTYVDGESLPDAYYMVHGSYPFEVSSQGSSGTTNLLVVEEVVK
jgi:hypothetical protein